jgi:hypothetical protein
MPAAYVGAAAAVFGAVSQSDAAKSAAGAQSQAAQQQLALQQQMYNTSQQQLSPYLQGGQEANGRLLNLLGLQDPSQSGSSFQLTDSLENSDAFKQLTDPIYAQYGATPAYLQVGSAAGQDKDVAANLAARQAWQDAQGPQTAANTPGFGSLTHSFDASDLNANMAPNYAFMLSQGQGQAQNAANMGGGALGGNALQGLNTFTQNYAQNAYQQAYNNYNTNQSNIYSRLAGVAQQGQNSAVQAGSNALTSAAQQSGSLAAQGQANASGIVGSANALAGGLNNAASYYNLGQIMNGSGSSGGYSVAGNGAAMGTGSGGFDDTGFSQYMTS